MHREPGRGNVLVCGIPGSGKTTYCEWLAREKKFLHLDFDQLLNGNGTPLKLSLVALLRRNPKDFVEELSRKSQLTVIDWGFPMESLPVVHFLKESGFTIWWFDGDRAAARRAFANRGTVSMEAFQAQMESIKRHWSQIEEVVGGNVIMSIGVGPTHVTAERIFAEMFGLDG